MAIRPIDQKIVAMKMDNSDFIKKASETTKSMGLLTSFLNTIPGINFGKTTNQLQGIQKSVNGLDTSRLADAVDTVTSRFSTLGIIGTTALVNITNRIIDATLAMGRKFTIAPIADGFAEYELQMGSIQTILANTAKYGTNVDDVSKALGELNLYADKTIYNFGEMTRNIGLFTNAGLKLEDSVMMIKGFSNAAAASGTGSSEAARAAYQLSQALSQGYLMQMDWMSISNAGMGNDNMKRDLIALGQAMGTLNVDSETAVKDWKRLLSDEKWLTTEVMSTYLRAMAGELDYATLKTIGLSDAQAELLMQNAKTGEEAATYVRTFTQLMSTLVEGVGSGWSESFGIIFGGFDDASKLWSGFSKLLSEPFDRLTDSRNKFLQSLKDAGVFEEIFVGIGTAIYVVGEIVGAVADGFDKAFSSDKVGIVSALAQGFKKVVSALTPSQDSLDKISLIFQALGSNVRVLMKILGDVGGLFLKLIPDNLGTNILSILSGFAKMNISFNEGILNGNGVKKVFEALGKTFSWIGDRIGNVIDGFIYLGSRISEFWTILRTGEAASNGVFNENSKIVVWLATVGNAVKSLIKSIASIDLSITPIRNTFKSFFSVVATGFNWLKEKLSEASQGIKDAMPSGTTLLAGGFVAGLTALVAIIYKRMNNFSKSFEDIFGGLGGIVDGFAEVLDSVSGALKAFSLNLHAKSLLTVAFAIGVLAGSIFLLSKVDGSKIGSSLTAMVGSLIATIGALAIIDKYNISGGLKASASIIGIALAVTVLAGALKKFGDLNPEQLTKGLISLTVVLGSIAGAFALMGKFGDKQVAATALQIVAISVSVLIMVKAIKEMGSMNPDELIKGISGLVAVIGAITAAFVLMGKFSGKGASTSALQFVAIAGSVIILVGAIALISKIDTADLLVGLGTITAILAVIAGFATLTSGKDLLSSSVGLLAISVAMNSLLIPILALGMFPLDKLMVGLLGLSGALLAIAVASKVMNGSLLGAATLTIMAVALNLLLIPIAAFAAMGWTAILTGVGGLALALGSLALVALLLSPATIPLLTFSAAIGVMGLALMAAGAGLTVFSTGILALAGLASAAVATIVATLGALITGLIALVPSAMKLILNVMIDSLKAILDKAPKIIDAIVDILVVLLKKIAEHAPKIIESFVKIVTNILEAFTKTAPKIINTVANLIVGILSTISDRIPDIIDVISRLLLTILGKMAEYLPKYVKAFITILTALIDALAEEAPKLINSVVNLLITLVETMAKTIDDNGPKFVNAFMDLVGSILTLIIETGTAVIKAMMGWIPGIEGAMDKVGKSAGKAIDDALETAKIGEDKGTDFADGISSTNSVVMKSAEELSTAANTGFNSVDSKQAGWTYGSGLATGMLASKLEVQKASTELAGALSDAGNDRLGVHSLGDAGIYTGTWHGKGLGWGAESQVPWVKKSGEKLGEGLASGTESGASGLKGITNMVRDTLFIKDSDVKDQEKKATTVGDSYTDIGKKSDKAAKTQVDGSKKVQDVLAEQFKKSKDWIDEQKYYQKMSLDEELQAWLDIQKQYKEGTEQRKQADREVFRLQMELIRSKEEAERASFNHSKQWISDRKYYNELSLKEELAAWERVQSRYKKGTEERKEADREVYRVRQELIKADVEHSKKWIDDRKYYNELSLKEELEAWERVQSRYAKGTEERKQADREVYRLKNELNNKLIQLNEEYTSKVQETNREMIAEETRLNDEYASRVEAASKKLFDDELRLKEDYERSVKDLNDRLISEEHRLTDEYNKAVDDRTRSLVNFTGLFDEVPNKSEVSGQKLIDNLKGQVDSFSNWSDDIKELSGRGIDEGLLSELRDMGPKASGEIKALNSLTDDQLSEYAELWKSKNELARTQAVSELETLNRDTQSKIGQLRVETKSQLESLKNDWLTKTTELRVQTAIQLEAYKNDWLTKTEQLRAQTAIQLEAYKTEWLKKIEEISKGTKEQFVDLSKDMKDIGADVIKGMMAGMKGMEGSLMAQAKAMADAVAATIQATLKIQSPSEVTEALGAFTGEGLAKGIASQVRNVSSRAKELALTAKDSLNQFLGGFGLPEEDGEIRIKAVVVWDGIDPTNLNAKPLRIMPNGSFTSGMIGEIRSNQRQNGSTILRDTNKDSQVVTREVNVEQHLTFNSRELTPSEVARKNLQASRQLAMQWG